MRRARTGGARGGRVPGVTALVGMTLCGALLLVGGGAQATVISDGDTAAVRATISEINATAGHGVAAQRSVLQRTVAADEAERQRQCRDATSTLAFDPAYRDMRHGSTAGEYLLPTYISIYRGGRIVGADLATLHLWVDGGTAHTAALCVS